jgi:hypothetical protein
MRLRLLHLLRLQGAASYLLPLGQRHCGCMSAAHHTRHPLELWLKSHEAQLAKKKKVHPDLLVALTTKAWIIFFGYIFFSFFGGSVVSVIRVQIPFL